MIIISCVLISACVSPPQAKEPAMTTVKVAYLPLISWGPVYIAKEEGYFAQQGINVELEKVQSTLSSSPPCDQRGHCSIWWNVGSGDDKFNRERCTRAHRC